MTEAEALALLPGQRISIPNSASTIWGDRLQNTGAGIFVVVKNDTVNMKLTISRDKTVSGQHMQYENMGDVVKAVVG
jgi:hypothetical protein